MHIKAKQLERVIASVFSRCKITKDLAYEIVQTMDDYDINTVNRLASFLAQCGHESQSFTRFVENLNYSASGLKNTFPKYLKGRNPDDYARQPEKIANLVYANRMGNGDELSGDGWRYRGRGIIQLTGKSNYDSIGNDIGQPLVDNPDLLSTDIGVMVKSAMAFWKRNDLNYYADKDDIKNQTRRINGGYNGLEERKQLYTILLTKFKTL